MVGIAAGKTWSRIGPEVAPTDSAASGVWTLQELAENAAAGTWPAPFVPGYIFFGAISPSAGDAGTSTFTNIPQDAVDLVIYTRLILNSGQNNSRLVIVPNSTSITNNEFQLQVNQPSTVVGGNTTVNAATGTKAMSYQYAAASSETNESVSTIFNYSSTTKEKTIFTEGSNVANNSDTSGTPSWSTTQLASIGSTAITSLSFVNEAGSTYGNYMDHAFAIYGVGTAV